MFTDLNRRNTRTNSLPFSEELIDQVWAKGQLTSYNNDLFRKDIYGNLMFRFDYGKTDSILGWEIDHIKPKSLGGSDNLNNLQPLQWQANRTKGDRYSA
jgi:hypothetical protein